MPVTRPARPCGSSASSTTPRRSPPSIPRSSSTSRPHARGSSFDDDLQREIVWPETTLASCRIGDPPTPVVTILGSEPQLRWRTFSEQVVGVARLYEARLVLTFGALLAEVPHTRPVSVFGTADDEQLIDELGLLPSRYEGPTGMTGVVQSACRQAGIKSAALWAAVPTYVPSATSPKAALALIDRASQLLGPADRDHRARDRLGLLRAPGQRAGLRRHRDHRLRRAARAPLRQRRPRPLRRRRGEPGRRGRALPARPTRLTGRVGQVGRAEPVIINS